MPPQVQQSFLMKKLGSEGEKIFNELKGIDAPTFQGGFDLPGGLKGIAKLVECKFMATKADSKKYPNQPMFWCSAIVMEPLEFIDKVGNKWKPVGMRTKIQEMMCDTPDSESKRKTKKEHMQKVIEYLITLSGQKLVNLTLATLEPFAAQLVTPGTKEKSKKPIYFRFHTFSPPPTKDAQGKEREPQVIHMWEDRILDYVPPGSTDGTQGVTDDATGGKASTNGATSSSLPGNPVSTTGSAHSPTKVKTPESHVKTPATTTVPVGSAEDFNNEDTLDSLLASANAGDENAQQEMGQIAESKGWSKQEVTDAVDWDALAVLCRTNKEEQSNGQVSDDVPESPSDEVAEEQPEESSPEEESQEPTFPFVGAMAKFKPYNKETKKYDLPEAICELIGYDSSNDTWSLKNMDNGKTTYSKVKADKFVAM